jgi:hypothetical protein
VSRSFPQVDETHVRAMKAPRTRERVAHSTLIFCDFSERQKYGRASKNYIGRRIFCAITEAGEKTAILTDK